MSGRPIISCIMSVYADDNYLENAIQSILKQTFEKFELIIINDGATDKCQSIIAKYRSSDSRITVINNDTNYGLAYALNVGIAYANGEYISRMDGDDISKKNRFEKQFLYMKKNPHIDILGSNIEVIDFDGKYTKNINFPENNKEISQRLKYCNCLAHPSVIMKLDIIKKLDGYDEHLRFAQDYDLWHRAMRAGFKFGNIQENLLEYRKADARSIKKLWSGFQIGLYYAFEDRSMPRVIKVIFYFFIAIIQNILGLLKIKFCK